MYADDNVRVAEALNDAFNRRDMAAAMHLAAEDARFINVATGQSFRGPDGVRQFLEGWATAFPDSRVETSRVIGGPDGAAIEFIGHGTQTGPLSTATGEVPPTGRHIEIQFAQVLRIEHGRIREARLYFDAFGMLQQLGLLPEAERTRGQNT